MALALVLLVPMGAWLASVILRVETPNGTLIVEIKDVRLVFAPHEAVGNYGGEVDNWNWPRHTGTTTRPTTRTGTSWPSASDAT